MMMGGSEVCFADTLAVHNFGRILVLFSVDCDKQFHSESVMIGRKMVLLWNSVKLKQSSQFG